MMMTVVMMTVVTRLSFGGCDRSDENKEGDGSKNKVT